MVKISKPIITAAIVLVILFGILTIFYTDFLWFKALEFQEIFTTTLFSKIALFFIGFGVFFLIATTNLIMAKKSKTSFSKKFGMLIIFVASIFIGIQSSSAWFTVLQYLKGTAFNLADPILGKDVAFYVFTLPFLNSLWLLIFSTVLLTTIFMVIYYLQQYLVKLFTQPEPDGDLKIIKPNISTFAQDHLFILSSLIFVLVAVKNYLARFTIMYSREGIVVGAGFTDVNIFLPVMKFLMVFALIVAGVFYVYIFIIAKKPKLKKHHILLFFLTLYVAFAIIGQVFAPAVVQSLKVAPNELNLEKPFIDNNIKFTRIAYGLDDIEVRDFDAAGDITRQDIENSKDTIDNIRILDYRPLTQTYKQTQEIRLYYDLSGIDLDRYEIDGKYTQVMLSTRELNQQQIMSNAQTWVNLHMIYTHGFGVVMSPVNQVTREGMPEYFIKDIPPVYTVENSNIKIDEPRIYYGNRDNNYIVVNTKTNEFDYPKGNTNEYINYDGNGGIVLDNFFDKVMMAIRFGDIKLLLSSDIKSDSKIMFMRNIQTRVSKLMPFLMLDHDPYITIIDGRLYWIQDAYTVTSNFPYSEKISNGINYMRNSVKVVIDAYNGDVSFYIAEPEDPIIQTYAKIFPNSFKPISEMPSELRKHIRYPEDLFNVQSSIFSTYHMEDTNVFYNKEDAWQTPKELYGTGQQINMDPYYTIMELPGENDPEFIIMIPFTPLRKDNMISWLAGRSDGENYGKLLLYKFPKDKLIYGPSQIEARIDQDSEISQQLTLWGQQGSRVTRGNLLVIPVGDSLLYVEPLYIQAEQGQLPELKRVFVSDGEKVVMEKTLTEAIDALFGRRVSVPKVDSALTDSSERNANSIYSDMLDAMNAGNWTEFGKNFDELGKVLASLE